MRTLVATVVLVIAGFGPVAVGLRGVRAADAPGVLGGKVEALLKRRCGTDGCHGANGKNSFHVLDRSEYIGGVVKPGDAAGSALLDRVAVRGDMPPGTKLPAAEVALLREWIAAGAPAAGTAAAEPARPFVTEAALLGAILRDVESAPDEDQPYLRYFSLVNLSNNPEVTGEDLTLFRSALSKLVNHLSWRPTITRPSAIGPQQLIYRIDLRHYRWDEAQWNQVLAAYPYGVKPRNLAAQTRAIQAATHATFPYIRVDWFIANASVPPLYYTLLKLPDTVTGLEELLRVDVERDYRQNTLRRFGLGNSGVSVSNRAMDRHESAYGAYWRSFDFADSVAERGHNIFANPLEFTPDGGEQIFHLPNGLQAYYISDAEGKRLDVAPEKVVANRSDPLGPTVVAGRSCMGCHHQGMIEFQDELGEALELLTNQRLRKFDQRKAELLLGGQKEVTRWIGNARTRTVGEDNRRFQAALAQTGSPLPADGGSEPISRLAQRFGGTLSLRQAAADAYFQDPAKFQAAVRTSRELLQSGFLALTGPAGNIKRDAWETQFALVVEELRLGDYLVPTLHAVRPVEPPAGQGLLRLAVGPLTGADPAQAAAARTQLVFFLNQSPRVRIQSDGRGDCNLKGTLRPAGGDAVTVSVGDPQRNLLEEATGPRSDVAAVVEQVANKVHFRLTGDWLPVRHAPPPAAAAPPAAGLGVSGGVNSLLQAVGNGQGLTLHLGLDRGPGATYRSGEIVEILVKVDRDAFVTLYSVDSLGKTTTLFPNSGTRSNHVRAGETKSFRAQVDPRGNFGAEQVIAVATLADQDLPGLRRMADGSKSLLPIDDDPRTVIEKVQEALRPAAAQNGAATAAVRFFTVR